MTGHCVGLLLLRAKPGTTAGMHACMHASCRKHAPWSSPSCNIAVAETASGKALAVARVLGSLCVLTARDGEGEGAAEGAMLASWVSQVRGEA